VLLAACSDQTPAAATVPEIAPAASAEPSPSRAAEAPAAPPAQAVDEWLPKLLRDADPRFGEWLAQAEELRLQILVTVVDPTTGEWQTHGFRVDEEYFYPASAIKSFLAVAALGSMSAQAGGDIPPLTRILRCRPDRPGCEPLRVDEDKDEGGAEDDGGKKKHRKLRVGDELRKLLAYSDNDSYNRLYDIVGHREVNETIAGLGFETVRFHHRMDAPADQSRDTLRVTLLPPGKKAITIPARRSTFEPKPTPAAKLEIGRAYRDKGRLVKEPMSFAQKNYVSLKEMQRLNLSLLFPEHPQALALGLSAAQRELLIAAMTARLSNKAAAAEQNPLSPGVLDVLPAARVRYVGKSGRAYGFHLDNAYIEEVATQRGFFVTVTVYANPDGVLNDDDYAYDEVSRPLLHALGAALTRALLVER
jgi:hypothetical protein